MEHGRRASRGGRGRFGAAVCALLVLLLPALAWAASISLDPSARAITTDEDLTLDMRIEGQFDDVREPTLTDWTVVGTSQRRNIVIGATAQSEITITYTLRPKKAGRLVIGQARLIAGGQVVSQAGPLQIQVTEPRPPDPTAPGQAADVSRHAGEPFFIVPVASESKVYAGQPFVLGFDLWVRGNVRAEARGISQTPKLAGFATEDILGGQNPRSNKRLGRNTYVVVTLKRDVLVPLEAGKAVIDPMELQLVAGDVFMQRQYTVKSEPVELDVLPLPEAGRPQGFDPGNVGQLTVKAELGGAASGTVGERMVVTVTAEGEGNLQGLEPPAPPSVEGARVDRLPGADTDGIIRDATGIHGAVRWSYIVTPSRPGTLTVPPFRLATFDPRAGRYAVQETAPLTVAVGKSMAQADGGQPETSTLKPIVTGVSLSDRPEPGGGPSPWALAVLALTFAGWAGVEVRWRVQRRQASQAGSLRARRALSTARARLREAEAHLKAGRVSELFSATSGALLQYVDDRFGFGALGLTHEALRARLTERGVPDELAGALVAELENCDFARFAPASTRGDEARNALDRASHLLADIDSTGATGAAGAAGPPGARGASGGQPPGPGTGGAAPPAGSGEATHAT